MDIFLRQCTLEDIDELCKLSAKTYYDTFAEMNTPENMAEYLKNSFSEEKLRSDMLNEASAFYFLYCGKKTAGYLKLNESLAQTDINDERSLEIQRIYVLKSFQGKGLGRYLMDSAVSIAKQKNKDYIWLGVWKKNEKAIRFYIKSGFRKIGTHSFIMGSDKQTDYIMRKDIAQK